MLPLDTGPATPTHTPTAIGPAAAAPDAAVPPLLLCGFRPFFLVSAGSAVVLVLAWLAMLAGLLPFPPATTGPVAWHAWSLLFGFGSAALAGFLLTAVPEFTASPPVRQPVLIGLLALWAGGRIAETLAFLLPPDASGLFLAPLPGPAVLAASLAAGCDIALVGLLIAVTAPPVLRDPERRHLAFIWALIALLAGTTGHHHAALSGLDAMPWINAVLGVFMALIVVALSRISMRMVNNALEAQGARGVEYLARPPRRNLAITCIAAFTFAELVAPGHPLRGWLALAAAAAMLNLTNDWHVGRALFTRWVLMLYAVYWMLALGYAAIGFALLTDTASASAGRHLLAIGGFGLSIFVVMNIAGRIHAGFALDTRAWVPAAAASLILAALVRAAGGLGAMDAHLAFAIAGLAWCAAFAMVLLRLTPAYFRPRPDDKPGCAG